jgi:hypothetical protein
MYVDSLPLSIECVMRRRRDDGIFTFNLTEKFFGCVPIINLKANWFVIIIASSSITDGLCETCFILASLKYPASKY